MTDHDLSQVRPQGERCRPSRRGLLGALSAGAVVLPLAAVPIVAAAQTVDRAAWDAALTVYRAAVAEADDFYERNVRHASYEETEGEGGTQAQYDVLAMAQWERLGELLLIPAPDLAALATKLELMMSECMIGATTDLGAPVAPVLLADVRRLGGEA